MLKKALLALVVVLFSFQAMASGSVLINGKEIKNREQLHMVFSKELGFSAQYPKTLEALYENLSTDYTSESIVKIKHVNLLKAKLGSEYIESMIQFIINAASENPRIIFVLE